MSKKKVRFLFGRSRIYIYTRIYIYIYEYISERKNNCSTFGVAFLHTIDTDPIFSVLSSLFFISIRHFYLSCLITDSVVPFFFLHSLPTSDIILNPAHNAHNNQLSSQ
jgi:hypothetical protein